MGEILLPTYEQVEKIKSSSGVVLDVNNKKYKARMYDGYPLFSDDGVDYSQLLASSMQSRFPNVASFNSLITLEKHFLWDNYYIIPSSYGYAIMDASSIEIVYAYDIRNSVSGFDRPTSLGAHEFFVDDRYIYLRGAVAGNIAFAVINKTTFEFVKVIKRVGSGGIQYTQRLSNSIVYMSDINAFFICSPDVMGSIMAYTLDRDVDGEPISFTPINGLTFTTVANSRPHGLVECNGYLYVFSAVDSTTGHWITKIAVNKTTKALSVVGSFNPPTSIRFPATDSIVYNSKDKNYALMTFSDLTGANGMVIEYDLDALTAKSITGSTTVMGSITFDHHNIGFYCQSGDVPSTTIDNRTFENAYKYYKDYPVEGSWTGQAILVETYNSASNKATNFNFANKSNWIHDGELYLTRLYNPNLVSTKLKNISIISHYEEVTE